MNLLLDRQGGATSPGESSDFFLTRNSRDRGSAGGGSPTQRARLWVQASD